MKQKKEKVKKNNSLVASWKKMSSEKKFIIVVLALMLLFIFGMPYLYKGWVYLRESGIFDKSKRIHQMVCSQNSETTDYKVDVERIIYYQYNQLRKEDYITTITPKKGTDKKIDKSIFDNSAASYKKYTGFTTNIKQKDQSVTLTVGIDYSKVEKQELLEIPFSDESDEFIDLQLSYDDKIEDVKKFYEDRAYTCKMGKK